ncbi:MAG: hypothetical protein KGH84_11920 [Paracoccaceae bacterium]|nr:hypothetical protein [Paracoccaceae bacterium]
MTRAGFVSSSVYWPWERQFPNGRPVWGDVEFVFEGDFDTCDVFCVFDAMPEGLSGRVQSKYSVFVASEPESVRKYNRVFLSQFDCVLTTDSGTRHHNVVFGQVGLPWHIGVYDGQGQHLDRPMTYNDFQSFAPEKDRLISVVSSDKAFTAGHRERLEFVDAMKRYFGSEVDYFGRNTNGFGDKTEVLSRYRYHIAIENCNYRDYWTEKLSDPILSLTYPLFHGCPNIADYFAPDTLTHVDIKDHQAALKTIKRIIESDVSERARSSLIEARRKVLDEYNLFAVLARIVAEARPSEVRPRRIYSESHVRGGRKRLMQAKNLFAPKRFKTPSQF